MVVRPIDYKKLECQGSALQSSYWAAVKHGTGWKPYAFSVEENQQVFSLLVLVKQVLPFWHLAYVPFGPPVSSLTLSGSVSDLIRQLSRQVKKLLPPFVFALRFDLPFDEPQEENVLIVNGPRLRTCRESVQPEGTVRIDLRQGYDQVVSRYRDRSKRALRKASQIYEIGLYSKDDQTTFKRWYDV